MQARGFHDITPGLPELDNSHGDLLERSLSEDSTSWPMFSPSQILVWDRCEYQWFLGYRRGWLIDRQSFALSTGTKVHEGMDVYYGNECSKDALMAWIKSEIDEANSDELEHLVRALYILEVYANHAPKWDQGRKPISTEIRMTVPFKTPKGRNYWFNGYADLLDEFKFKYTVTDHKTTSQGFWTPRQCAIDPQTLLYGAALREYGYPIHSTCHNMLNTYPYKKMREVPVEKLFQRVELVREDSEFDAALRQFGKAVDVLLDRYAEPRRSLRKDCDKCQFVDICLLKNQGVAVGPTLKAKFTKKEGTASA